MKYWLVKQEPEAYSWSDLVKEGATVWTGIRNFQARNNLRAMTTGDSVLFYHSVSEKRVVGVAAVIREAYPDPTAREGDWSVVDLKPVAPLASPVTLAEIKSDPVLRDMALVRQSRLSVVPVTTVQFRKILKISGTRL